MPRGRVRFETPSGRRDRSPARYGLGANDTSTAANLRTGFSSRANTNSPPIVTSERSNAPSFGDSSTAVDTQPTAASLRGPPKRRNREQIEDDGFEQTELKPVTSTDRKVDDDNHDQAGDANRANNPITPTREALGSVQTDGANTVESFYTSIEGSFRVIGTLIGMFIEHLAMLIYRALRLLLPHSREEAGISLFFTGLVAAQIYVACILDLPHTPPHWVATVVSALVGTGSAGIVAAWRTRNRREMQAGHWFFVVSCNVCVEIVAIYLLRNVKDEVTGESVVSEAVKRMLDG